MTGPIRNITIEGQGAPKSFGVAGTGTPSRDSSVPAVRSATIVSAQTAAAGANWTSFASTPCAALDLVNNSGTGIEYRRNGGGVAMPLADKSARLIVGITNANQIQVRRTDTSNTQVTVQGEALT